MELLEPIEATLTIYQSDSEASRMKMGDGGFRPAVNVQLAVDTESRAIVGVDVSSEGVDYEQSEPMREQADLAADAAELPVGESPALHAQHVAPAAPRITGSAHSAHRRPRRSWTPDMPERHTCPSCGESEALRGRPVQEDIELVMGGNMSRLMGVNAMA